MLACWCKGTYEHPEGSGRSGTEPTNSILTWTTAVYLCVFSSAELCLAKEIAEEWRVFKAFLARCIQNTTFPSLSKILQCPKYLETFLFNIYNCLRWINFFPLIYFPDYFKHIKRSLFRLKNPSNSCIYQWHHSEIAIVTPSKECKGV